MPSAGDQSITITFMESKQVEGSKYSHRKIQKRVLPAMSTARRATGATAFEEHPAADARATSTTVDEELQFPRSRRSGRQIRPVKRYEPVETVTDDLSASDDTDLSSDEDE